MTDAQKEREAIAAHCGTRICGYVALFDIPDKGGDIIRKGAFQRAAKAGIPLLWQHDRSQRIGFVESVAEDERGLRIIAVVDSGQVVSVGQGLSFGYRVRKSESGKYRELFDLQLIEVSLVTHPMQPSARVLETIVETT
jgi:uncharacterized protein